MTVIDTVNIHQMMMIWDAKKNTSKKRRQKAGNMSKI